MGRETQIKLLLKRAHTLDQLWAKNYFRLDAHNNRVVSGTSKTASSPFGTLLLPSLHNGLQGLCLYYRSISLSCSF